MPDARLLSVNDETSLFWRMRSQLIANVLGKSIRQSRLRISMIAVMTVILWTVLFLVFVDGFHFLNATIQNGGTLDETVRAIYSIFFASLTIMLVFSTGILLYGSLYCSAETRFLLTTPARAERIFLHKFQESMLFSSWAFLLLGSPMLMAYGFVQEAGWFYYLVLLPFLIAFAYIPGSLGALLCLVIVRWLRLSRTQLFVAGLLTLLGVSISIGTSLASGVQGDLLTPGWFQEVLARVRFSEYRLLPNWWLSSGLLEAVRGGFGDPSQYRALSESGMFLALTISNALAFHQLAVWASGRTYRSGYLEFHAGLAPRRRLKAGWIDRLVSRSCFFLPAEIQLLILKDVRLFRRDPVQWSQFTIFLALLLLYFANTRRLGYEVEYSTWVNMVSFLNLAIIGLILSTFTTRFIFPLISLEGRRFWIVGLLPIRRETILWGKFLFAAAGSFIPCLILVLFSDWMLGISRFLIGVHLLVCGLLASGLSGIAVGLGARLPDLRQESPARIAAGFGGTLTLILSTIYIVAVVCLVAVPCHFYLAVKDTPSVATVIAPERLWLWLVLGATSSVILGIVATAVPLWIGFKAFRELEV